MIYSTNSYTHPFIHNADTVHCVASATTHWFSEPNISGNVLLPEHLYTKYTGGKSKLLLKIVHNKYCHKVVGGTENQ